MQYSKVAVPGFAIAVALYGAAAWIFSFAPACRLSLFKQEFKDVQDIESDFQTEHEKIVLHNIRENFYPRLALPTGIMCLSDEEKARTVGKYKFFLDMDIFENAVGALAECCMWPHDYFHSQREYHEAQRLAYYLVGVAKTYISNGPVSITENQSTTMNLALLYHCAAMLGIKLGKSGAFRDEIGFANATHMETSESLQLISTKVTDRYCQNNITSWGEIFIVTWIACPEFDHDWFNYIASSPRRSLIAAFASLKYGKIDAYNQHIVQLAEQSDRKEEILALLNIDHTLPISKQLDAFQMRKLSAEFKSPLLLQRPQDQEQQGDDAPQSQST